MVDRIFKDELPWGMNGQMRHKIGVIKPPRRRQGDNHTLDHQGIVASIAFSIHPSHPSISSISSIQQPFDPVSDVRYSAFHHTILFSRVRQLRLHTRSSNVIYSSHGRSGTRPDSTLDTLSLAKYCHFAKMLLDRSSDL